MRTEKWTRWMPGLLVLMLTPLFCGGDWLQFRGSQNTSVAPDKSLPRTWTLNDVSWSVSLPGRCVSGPIAVDSHIITTSSNGLRNERLHVWAVSQDTGKVTWHRQLWATGRSYCHPLSSMASPTPTSDGSRIYVLFASNDLVCLDLSGKLLWMRALGVEFPLAFDDRGLGSSPLLAGGTLVVQTECKGDSAVLGIDSQQGTILWRQTLPRGANWCSPTVFPTADGDLILVQSLKELLVIEPSSGKILNRYEAQGSSIPSLAVADDTIFLPANGLTSLRCAPGKAPELLWRENRLGPQTSSPVVRGDRVYVIRAPSILVCGNAMDGKILWRERLKGDRSWATPVLAGDLLYTVSMNGLVQVVDVSGPKGEVVGEIDMQEEMLGSPAVANNALYLRGVEHLWKIQ